MKRLLNFRQFPLISFPLEGSRRYIRQTSNLLELRNAKIYFDGRDAVGTFGEKHLFISGKKHSSFSDFGASFRRMEIIPNHFNDSCFANTNRDLQLGIVSGCLKECLKIKANHTNYKFSAISAKHASVDRKEIQYPKFE